MLWGTQEGSRYGGHRRVVGMGEHRRVVVAMGEHRVVGGNRDGGHRRVVGMGDTGGYRE